MSSGTAAVVGGVIGLGLGAAIASARKVQTASAAPAPTPGPTACVNDAQAGQWADSKNLDGILVGHPADVATRVAPAGNIVIDGSTCNVYTSPTGAAGSWQVDTTLSAELKAFVSGVKAPTEPVPDVTLVGSSSQAQQLSNEAQSVSAVEWVIWRWTWLGPTTGHWTTLGIMYGSEYAVESTVFALNSQWQDNYYTYRISSGTRCFGIPAGIPWVNR